MVVSGVVCRARVARDRSGDAGGILVEVIADSRILTGPPEETSHERCESGMVREKGIETPPECSE